MTEFPLSFYTPENKLYALIESHQIRGHVAELIDQVGVSLDLNRGPYEIHLAESGYGYKRNEPLRWGFRDRETWCVDTTNWAIYRRLL